MHLTRTGYNILVIVWLAPLVVLDFVGNTISTGTQSDYFYYKTMIDGLLIAYALWQCFRPATGSASTVHHRIADHEDEVVGFEKLGAIEYVYCAVLTLYAAANWYFMHQINKESEGIVSIATLAWSFVSIGVALLSAVQFYHLKSGAIVELKHRVVQ